LDGGGGGGLVVTFEHRFGAPRQAAPYFIIIGEWGLGIREQRPGIRD
jgi:hypothetical protein